MAEKSRKQRIIERAKQIGIESEKKYIGCAQSTFDAICKTFKEEEIDLFTPEEQEKIFKGMVGLQGGTGGEGIGTCGAVSGPSFIVSYLSDIGTNELHNNIYSGSKSCMNVIKGITSQWLKQFGSIVCNDICMKRWHRALSFKSPESMREFIKLAADRPECQDTRCTVAIGAGIGAGAVCDILGIE